MRWIWLALCIFTRSAISVTDNEHFDEQLIIKPLSDGKVASTFIFTTTLRDAAPRDVEGFPVDDEPQHFTLFPLALGQILREYAVTELHLTLNSGNWNYEKWGYPTELGVGTGAELWAWMHGSSSSIDHRWRGLRNALAGLFCASLGALNDERTTSPATSFTPEGSLPKWKHNSTYEHQIRHASLASENVCTENLTPFFKLLPCKSMSGLASLFNPYKLFDADWHGLGVNVLWNAEVGVTVRLTFQMVSDPLRYSSHHKRDWSLYSLFDRRIAGTCPVANSSRVSVELPTSAPYSLLPEPTSLSSGTAHYDLLAGSLHELDVAMKWPTEVSFDHSVIIEPFMPLNVHRTLLGSSQAHGTLSIVITNAQSSPIHVLYLETMPWLVQFYMHTLTVEVDSVDRRDLVAKTAYIPSVPHSRPTTLECLLYIPGNVSMRLTIELTKSFLRYTDHPPDAQRGWDLPPAVLLPILSPENEFLADNNLGRIYTPALLVDLATPDFSMPYNVIIFSCSVVAFIFGSVFNLLTRKFVAVRLLVGDDGGEKEM